MMPTYGQAARMNALAYANDPSMGVVEEWAHKRLVACERTGCVVAHWEHDDGTVYLAVRGSSTRRDVAEDVRVFLGHAPKGRIAFLENYIQQHCQQALSGNQLVVGGHSLGGTVAQGVASRWNLPGLIQNAPGWLVEPPAPHTLAKLVEVRTKGDVVGVWGHCTPTTLRVQDPNAKQWSFRELHNADRQVVLIEQEGWGAARLDDPEVAKTTQAVAQAQPVGVWRAVKAALTQATNEVNELRPNHKPR